MKRDGFTLFEVLMTLSILAVVLSMLYMTFHQSMAAVAHTEERAEVIQQGRMILERMTAELKGVFLPPQPVSSPAYRYGLVGRSAKEGGYFRDRIDFTASAPPHAYLDQGTGDILEIGYSLDHAPGAKGFTLFRRHDHPGDGDLLHGGRVLPICDQIRGLKFVFFNRDGESRKEWNSLEGAQRNQLPQRIGIELSLEDGRGAVHTFRTQVYLTASGDRG